MSSVMIDGVEYVQKESRPKGSRAVVVVDRGWIFAGDVEERDGRIYLTDAVWVFRWESIGFNGVIADPKSSKVDIRKIDPVDIPASSEIFRIPVSESWGL